MNMLMKSVTVAGAMFVVAGCGALFNSGPAQVTFNSSPAGATVWVDGSPRGNTPVVLHLDKNTSHTVVFKMDGYQDVARSLSKKVSAGYVVLDVLGGLIPVIIDAATGSWYTLSTNSINVSMAENDQAQLQGTLSPYELAQLKRGVPAEDLIDWPSERAKIW